MFLARPATCESTTDVASRLSRAQPPKAVQQLHSIRLGLTVVTERTERARAQSPPCPAPCRVKSDNIDGSWNPPPGGPGNHGGKEHLSMYCYLDPPPSSDAHLPACAALNPDCPGPASQLPQMRTSQRTITGDSHEYTVDARYTIDDGGTTIVARGACQPGWTADARRARSRRTVRLRVRVPGIPFCPL